MRMYVYRVVKNAATSRAYVLLDFGGKIASLLLKLEQFSEVAVIFLVERPQQHTLLQQ